MAKPLTLNEAYVKNVKNAPPFGTKDKIGYMLGDLGFNSLQVIVNSYLMLFCVNILGIDAVHFASIVFICKALDALNDTFIGQCVDNRPATKWGKMKPYLKWFAIPYMIFTIVLFMDVTAMPYVAKIAWVLVIYFIWGIVGTFINVPYGAMTNIMTTDLVQRTELSNFRSIGSALGAIVPATVAPLLLFDANNDPIASRFILLSVVLGVFCVVCLLLSHKLMSERVLVTPDSNISAAGEKINYWQVAKSFAKNRIMISVVLAYVTTKLFTQPVATINQYVFMVYFQDTALLSLTSLTAMVPMILGMILIKPMVKKFGKKNLVTWPVLFSAVCYGLTAVLPMSPMTWIICQLGATIGAIGTGLLQWSLISDAVDYQAYLTGVRNDGTVYATITFIVFFAASAATSIVAVMLDLLGYDASLGSMNQLAGVAERIKFFGGAWPMIGSIIIFVCYKLIYNIGDDEMRKVSATVKAMADEKEAKAMAQMEQN